MDILSEWVVELFSEVCGGEDEHKVRFRDENNQRLIPEAYGAEQVQKYFEFVPIKAFRVLRLLFPMEPSVARYLDKSTRYISHLIGHEGSGSIFQVLQQKGWATALVAGEMVTTTDFDLFGIDISLTIEGQQFIDQIISLIFSYVAVIEESGIPEWIYDEVYF